MSALPPKADIGYVSDLINFQSSIVFFEVSSAPLKICHLTRRLIGGWFSSRQGDDRISWDNDPPYNLIHGNLQRLAVSSRSILRTAKNDGCDRIHTALLSQRQDVSGSNATRSLQCNRRLLTLQWIRTKLDLVKLRTIFGATFVMEDGA